MQTINSDIIDWEKYEQRPAEAVLIRSCDNWLDGVVDRFGDGLKATGIRLPWHKTWNNFRFRPGEVTLWSGMNGHGKSILLGYVTLGMLAQQNQKACIASMEMTPASTVHRIARQAIGTQWPTNESVVDFVRDYASDKLYLYDQQGTVNSERIIALARYCHEELGVTQFIIDSLMKCGIRSDDYNRQAEFVDELTAHARDTGQHVHLVAHSKKLKSEEDIPGKYDIKGASEISDQVDNVLITWRNKKKERCDNDDSDVLLICAKQRHYEWEGAIKLWFHKGSYQYHESDFPNVEGYLELLNRMAK